MPNRQADRDGVCSQEPLRLHGLWANRHAWALRDSGDLLAAALRRDTSAEAREVEKLTEEQIPAQIVSLILEKADPTRNKGMTAWLVRQYGQGHLRLEDLGTANETLTMFRRYAPRLGPGQRDLGRYQNLAAVWEAVIAFANAEEQQISGKAQKALDRDKAYAESRILHQTPDGFTVAVPLTEFAAKWWGKGTRWCTAAEKDNKFWHYHWQAPLIVVVIPELGEKGKFQLWTTKGDVQFMDAADKPVSDILITEYWPRFETVISFAIRQNGQALWEVPQKLRKEGLCRIAVAQNGLALAYVIEDLRSEERCRIAVAQRGRALEFVPQKLRTEEICRIAVAQDGGALGDVPAALRAEDMCRISVAQNGRALQYVPEALRTEDLCRIAVTQNGWALKYVPQKLRTDEMCRIAVTQNGHALCDVPCELRTEEMFRIALTQNGHALQHLPWALRTEEMCRIAVAQDGWALGCVPSVLLTEEMCRIAVAQYGGALEFVPQKLRTEEMCRIAVTQNGWALPHVPRVLRTEEICKIAVTQNGWALKSVPDALRSEIQQFAKPPQPSWDLAILDQWTELMMPERSSRLSGGRHA